MTLAPGIKERLTYYNRYIISIPHNRSNKQSNSHPSSALDRLNKLLWMGEGNKELK